MKPKPDHPVSAKRVAFCCLLFSAAFALTASLTYWFVLPHFPNETNRIQSEIQTGSLGSELIVVTVVTIFIVALGVGAVWFFLAVSLDVRRFSPDHFSASANAHWLLWGGLTGIMSVAVLRLSNAPAVYGAILQGAIVVGCVFVSYWIAFRLYPLPQQNPAANTEKRA